MQSIWASREPIAISWPTSTATIRCSRERLHAWPTSFTSDRISISPLGIAFLLMPPVRKLVARSCRRIAPRHFIMPATFHRKRCFGAVAYGTASNRWMSTFTTRWTGTSYCVHRRQDSSWNACEDSSPAFACTRNRKQQKNFEVGRREMQTLRLRSLGHLPTQREIYRAMLPNCARQFVFHWSYRFGLVKQ
jgi:hypothetical protein